MLTSCLSIIGIFPSQIIIESEFDFPEYLKFQDLQKYLIFEEELRLHKLFYTFYENRQILIKPTRVIPQAEYSFKPQILAESELLGKKKKDEMGEIGSQKRYEYIMQEKQKAAEKVEKAKLEKEEEELKKCTFKPKILNKKNIKEINPSQEHRTLALYEISKQVKDKPIKSSQEIELEKNLAECTFAPQIKRVKLKEETNGLYNLSVQKNILRLQKAREEEARKKLILDGVIHAKSASLDLDYDKRIKASAKFPIQRIEKSPEKGMLLIDLANIVDNYNSRISESTKDNNVEN